MFQAPLPMEYASLSPDETEERIRNAKFELGSDAIILGHHYQRDEIIKHADYRGDSYKLCVDAKRNDLARRIIFCGVHFMAESAVVLTDKRVYLPNLAAGCSMADMANIFQVRKAWSELQTIADTSKIVPITYINSAANLKAFVGENGGSVCTSTNAPHILRWALERSEKVLFFPDQHLGRNTAVALGFDPNTDMAIWDPFKQLGGNYPEDVLRAKFLLWKGHCSVHARFNVSQISAARAKNPSVNIIVHPECSLDVVQASDFNGSTEYIIDKIKSARNGSSWAIGTEINLVKRLAAEYPNKTVACLDPQVCPCSTMYRIHPSFLLWCLESLIAGAPRNEIIVSPEIRKWAKVSLDNMIEITSKGFATATFD